MKRYPRNPQKGLGEAADATPTLAHAQHALADAEKLLPLDRRLAADAAYLAATQAADVAALSLGRKPPEGTRDRRHALRELDRVLRNSVAKVGAYDHFNRVHDLLHGDCFHEGRCVPSDVKDGLRSAAVLVATVGKRVGWPKP